MFTLFTCLEFLMYFRYECLIRNKFYKYIFLSGLLCRLFVFLFYFVLRGRTERELIFNLFPKCLQSWYWSVLNQGARNSIQVSHLGSRWPNYLNYHLYQVFLKVCIYLSLFERQRDRRRDWTSVCWLLITTRAGPGSGNLIWLSQLGGRDPAWANTPCLIGYPLTGGYNWKHSQDRNPPGTSIWAFRLPTLCPNRYAKCTPRQCLLKGVKS